MSKKTLAIGLAVVLLFTLAAGEGVLLMMQHNKPSKQVGAVASPTYTRLNIELKDGQLTSPASTYIVQPGIGLEFHISSNIFGQVSVPTQPPQTITFTKSPLVFHFNVSTKPGTYALLFRANGTNDVLQIGTIIVRGR